MALVEVTYPAKNFPSITRTAISDGLSLKITITSSWRIWLLRKSIAYWPRTYSNIDRASQSKGPWFAFASYLLFSLFHMHVRAMTANYQMSYELLSHSIEMRYHWLQPA